MLRPSPVLLTALTGVLLATSCAAGTRGVAAPNAWPRSSVVPAAPPEVAATDEPTDEPTAEPMTDTGPAWPEEPPLVQVWMADPPRGTGAEIALRFLQALQRGDDLAADRELYVWGRQELASSSMSTLHRVMRDVRRNADLAHAGPCTRAARLATESAVVTCGGRHIVVHVMADDDAHGVQVGDWHVHHDVYRGPHTHAFTTIDY